MSILVNDNIPADNDPFVWRPIDKVLVKGKREPVQIYQPLCFKNQLSQEMKNSLTLYKKALNDYYDQHWEQAQKAFKMLSAAFPDEYLYALYLERIDALKHTPPAKDWQGVFTHTSKKYR